MHLTVRSGQKKRNNEGITFVAFANLSQLVVVQIRGQVVVLVHLCTGCFYDNHRQIPFQP